MSMFKQLAYAALCTATVYVAGCRNTTTNNPPPQDFAVTGDMAVVNNTDMPTSGGGDMAVMYPATTVNAIDTSTTGIKAYVGVSGLYVFSNVYRTTEKGTGANSNKYYCEYYVYVQDATCATPPCGLRVYAETGLAPSPSPGEAHAGGGDCPHADAANAPKNALSSTKQGDTIDVEGFTDYFPGYPTCHYINADVVTKSATQATMPAPMAVPSPALFNSENPTGAPSGYDGAPKAGVDTGWKTYEGTYVTLTPSSPFTIAPFEPSPSPVPAPPIPDNFGNFFAAANGYHVQFNLDIYFGPTDMGGFPVGGATYSSLSGWVNTDFGGGIIPVQASDFAP